VRGCVSYSCDGRTGQRYDRAAGYFHPRFGVRCLSDTPFAASMSML
jgi:hypothetical protein